MIPNVYLALGGTGKMLSAPVDLGMYITDADSVLKFGAISSDEMVATVTATDGMLTITAIKVGTATITATAHDGSNAPVPAEIMVTVVKTNAAPTTNGLSGSDKTKIEMPLFIADGTKPFTVTIVSMAGAADPVVDSIVDYAVVIGKENAKKPGVDADPTDDMVSVMVKKDTGNKYVIEVTPKATAKGMQPVMIYPKDMFGAMVSKPWEFKAMFNTPPSTVTNSLDATDTIPLDRADVASGETPDVARTAVGSRVILISDYFKNLQTMPATDAAGAPLGSTPESAASIPKKVGDTVCEVSPATSSLALVLPLNSFGADALGTGTDTNAKAHLVDSSKNHALVGILIDTRYSSLGDDMIVSAPAALKPANTDTFATGVGTLDIMITCTDKDASVSVTGKVVVRQLSTT